ncbi:MAG: DUF2269 family protein [Oligella ureolytica]|nr:DUF2269 family protein [Oligella ureolytica]
MLFFSVNFTPGAHENSAVILNNRHLINLTTWGLGTPSLILLFFGGLMMIMRSSAHFERRRWLILHLIAAAITMIITTVALSPLGSEIYNVTQTLPHDPDIISKYLALKKIESMLAVPVLCFAVIVIYLPMIKPRFRHKKQKPKKPQPNK